MNKKLEHRKIVKSKKPDFKRQDSHKLKKLDTAWRRPKGLQSKMRIGFKGYNKKPSQGYRSPLEVRGLNNKGQKEVLISNLKDLNKVQKEEHIVIASKVGNKKRIRILEEGLKLKLNFTIKNPQELVEELKKSFEEKIKINNKKKKSKEEKEKTKNKEEKKSKDIEAKKEEVKEAKTEEEKKEKEKKEKDKILTQKSQ